MPFRGAGACEGRRSLVAALACVCVCVCVSASVQCEACCSLLAPLWLPCNHASKHACILVSMHGRCCLRGCVRLVCLKLLLVPRLLVGKLHAPFTLPWPSLHLPFTLAPKQHIRRHTRTHTADSTRLAGATQVTPEHTEEARRQEVSGQEQVRAGN